MVTQRRRKRGGSQASGRFKTDRCNGFLSRTRRRSVAQQLYPLPFRGLGLWCGWGWAVARYQKGPAKRRRAAHARLATRPLAHHGELPPPRTNRGRPKSGPCSPVVSLAADRHYLSPVVSIIREWHHFGRRWAVRRPVTPPAHRNLGNGRGVGEGEGIFNSVRHIVISSTAPSVPT